MPRFINAGVAYDMSFLYTCLGTEGDEFVIPFPTARADTNYVATVQLAKSVVGAQYLCSASPTAYTTTGITVITGVAPQAGDVLAIIVEEQNS